MKVVAFVVFSLLLLQSVYALNNKIVESYLGFGYPRQGNAPAYYRPSSPVAFWNADAPDFDTWIQSYNVNGFIAATWQPGQPLAQVETMKVYLEFPTSDRDRYLQCFPRVRQLTFDSVITDRAQIMTTPGTQTGAQTRWAVLEFLARANSINSGWYTFEFTGNASDVTSWRIGAAATAQGKAFEVSVVDIVCFSDSGNWDQVYLFADRQADPNLKVSGVLNYNWTYEASFDAVPDNQISVAVPIEGGAVLYHLFANPTHYVGGFPRSAPETPSLAVPTLSNTVAAFPTGNDGYHWIFGSHNRGEPLTAITSVDVYLTNVPADATSCALGVYQIIYENPITSRDQLVYDGAVSLSYGYKTLPTNVSGNGWYTFRPTPVEIPYSSRFRLSTVTVGYRGSIGKFDVNLFHVDCSGPNGPVTASIVVDTTQQEPNNPFGGLQTQQLVSTGTYSAPFNRVPGVQAVYYHMQGKTYNFVEPATSAPPTNPGTDYSGVRCQTQQCCESYQRPNADSGNGYWELSSICAAGTGGVHCIQETGCNLCHDPSAPYSNNIGNRPFCQRFIPVGECTSQQCCTMRQIPNPQTGNGYLEYDVSCKGNGGTHCMATTGCKLCYIPTFDQSGMMTNNIGNRPVCSWA